MGITRQVFICYFTASAVHETHNAVITIQPTPFHQPGDEFRSRLTDGISDVDFCVFARAVGW
jgi:hypothetical protein